jgi:hypothetical protein
VQQFFSLRTLVKYTEFLNERKTILFLAAGGAKFETHFIRVPERTSKKHFQCSNSFSPRFLIDCIQYVRALRDKKGRPCVLVPWQRADNA